MAGITIRDIGILFGYEVDESSENRVEDSIKSLKETATKLLGGVAVVVTIKKAAQFISDCVAISSEVEEMENKFDVVFYHLRDEVDQWAEDYADAIGRNKNSIKTYLADQQNLLVGFGMTREAGAELAKQMTTLGLDLASFANMDEDQAVNAVTRAVMGNADAARTLGAVLNEQTRAQAMEVLGLKGKYDALDQLTKMQVNYQAILSQSPDALGDCARSMGIAVEEFENFQDILINNPAAIKECERGTASYESTLRQFNAKLLEIKQLVGGFFMPTAQKALAFGAKLLTKTRDLMQKFSDFATKVGGVERILKVLAATFAAVSLAMNFKDVVSTISKVTEAIKNLNFRVVGLVAIVLMLALLVDDFFSFMRGEDSVIGTILERAGVDCDKFRENVIQIWNNIRTVLSSIWQGIQNVAIPVFKGIWGAITTVFKAIGDIIKKVAPHVADFVDKLASGDVDTETWTKVAEIITTITLAIVGVIAAFKVASAIFNGVTAAVKGIGAAISFLTSPVALVIAAIAAVIAIVYLCVKHWDKIKAAFIKAWESIKGAWNTAASFFKGIWDSIMASLSPVLEAIGNAFSAAWELIKTVWAIAAPFFEGVWSAIKAIFSMVVAVLGGAFRSAWAVIQAVWSVAVGWFKLVWEGIKSVFSVAKAVIGGFFRAAWTAVKAVWNTAAGYFQMVFNVIAGIFSLVKSVLSGDFQGAWDAIKGIWSAATGYFSTLWESIKSIFGAAVEWFGGIFSAAWEAVKSAFSAVGDFFQGVWDTIVNLFSSIGTAVGDAISGAVKGAINAVLSGATAIINGFISAINVAIDVINAIPGVSIDRLNSLAVPQLAEGGYVEANKPRHVIIGDNKHEGEIVSPISKMRETVLDALRAFSASGAMANMAALVKSVIPSANTVSTATGGSASKVINFKSEINQNFNGDAAAQKNLSQAADSAAEDTTGALARALAYSG